MRGLLHRGARYHVQVASRLRPGHMPTALKGCPGHVLTTSGSRPGHVKSKSQLRCARASAALNSRWWRRRSSYSVWGEGRARAAMGVWASRGGNAPSATTTHHPPCPPPCGLSKKASHRAQCIGARPPPLHQGGAARMRPRDEHSRLAANECASSRILESAIEPHDAAPPHALPRSEAHVFRVVETVIEPSIRSSLQLMECSLSADVTCRAGSTHATADRTAQRSSSKRPPGQGCASSRRCQQMARKHHDGVRQPIAAFENALP